MTAIEQHLESPGAIVVERHDVDCGDAAREPIVVVGIGPVGIHFAQRVLNRDPACPLILYGDEPWAPYDRVRLTSLLAGEAGFDGLSNQLRTTRSARVISHLNCAVVKIDRQRSRVRDQLGRWRRYGKLVLAVGSSAAIPNVPGIDLRGVFKLRDMSDVERLMARRARSRTTVVLGGGLLGLEVARAMQRGNTRVVLLHRGPRLLNRQLDETASAMVQAHVEGMGIVVELNAAVRAVHGTHGVERVLLNDGRALVCDTVVVAAGILPNIQLARDAGISVGRGIRVNDAMQTSAPGIYAIGECAEHRDQVHGIVAPGLEQARVAAEHILGGQAAYSGSTEATALKVVGQATFSIGRVGDDEDLAFDRAAAYHDADRGLYRKVVTRGGRAVGAVAIGEWAELGRVREAVINRRRLWPWQRWRLRQYGRLWPESSGSSVRQWPANATVCNCRGVTRGTLSSAMDSGAATLQALMRDTGASTVCGSCRPLLEDLLQGADAAPAPAAPVGRGLLTLSLTALVIAPLFGLLAPIPYTDSAQFGWTPDALWTDGLWKQISGFTLVGLSFVGMALSLRKRTRVRVGNFGAWRLLHVALGIAALALLGIHTGLHLGNNLNRMLIINFLALSAIGAVAGGVSALEQRLPARWGGRLRRWWTWAHILVLWPLPVLLGFHILAVYYY
ncbi:MAG: FAD-dependent oxidoreductase [Aquisalimonadaceae bacterium]